MTTFKPTKPGKYIYDDKRGFIGEREVIVYQHKEKLLFVYGLFSYFVSSSTGDWKEIDVPVK